ncbi:MAG: hypothetical protein ACR2QC_10955 [Gammaproteobacteria bacterium]
MCNFFAFFLLFLSHSCEGRNLRRRKAAGNCTITAFGVEIPAFAGMGRRGGNGTVFFL